MESTVEPDTDCHDLPDEGGGNGRLDVKAEALAQALAAGKTVADAAEAAGISERTAYRRRGEEDFAARVRALQDEAWGRGVARLSSYMTEAAEILMGLARGAEKEGVRRAAARDLFSLGMKSREVHELAERVAALEQITAEETGTR